MRKFFFPVVIVIIVALALSYQPLRISMKSATFTILGPFQGSLSSAGKHIESWFSFAGSISRLRKENANLSSKILSLEIDRSRIAELEYENALLKNEIGFTQDHPEVSLVPAKIIGREPTSFLDNCIIDKGSEDGVGQDMTVIFGGALVGQIKEIYPHQSKVILITSKDSIVQAMLENSRAKGILRGGVSGLMLEDITSDVQVGENEAVLTSGLDGEITPGLLIGITSESKSTDSGLFKNIAVEPAVDLSKLEMVFLVK